jgi:apolipoprotein N-acyltransferase
MGSRAARERGCSLRSPGWLILATASTAASGLLASCAFAPLDLDAIVFVALVPFFAVLPRVGLGTAVWLGWVWCFVYSTQVAGALPDAVESYFQQPIWASWALAGAIWTGTGCLYYMAFAPLYTLLTSRFLAWLPWLAASAWVTAELARGRLWNELGAFVANPWALLGYALPADGPIGQIASLGGVYLVGFAIVSANAGLAVFLLPGRSLRPARRVLPLVLGLAPALAAAVFGYARLSTLPPDIADGEPVALVQADLELSSRWRRDQYGKNLAIYVELTRRTLAEARPAVVYWPEAAMTFFVEEEAAYREAIAAVLGTGDAHLVAGGPRRVDADGEVFNSVFHIDRDGAVRGRYDKRYLVPFSEYFPLRVFDFVRRRFDDVRSFARGSGEDVLDTPVGQAGVLICNEALFPEVAGRRRAAGATYLLSPSNDSWIPSAEWADRMFAFSAYRAVEQGLPVLRVSTSGPSGVVDALGRTQVRSEPFSQKVVLGRLPRPTPPSLYARVGDAFSFACAVAVAAGGIAACRGGRRRSQTQPSRSSQRSTA